MEARREQPVERRVLRGRGGKMEFEVERTRVPHTGTCRPAVSPPECPSQPGGASPGVSVTAVTLLKRASRVLGLSTRCPFPPTPLPGGRSTCRPRVPGPRLGPGKATAGVWASRGFRCGSVGGRSLSGSRVAAPTGLAPGLWDRAPSPGRGPCSEGLWPQAADLGRGRGRAELAASLLRGRPAARLWRPSPWPGLPVSPVRLQLRPRP